MSGAELGLPALEALGAGGSFPVEFARSQFRALAKDCDEVLMDNAGGSQIAQQCVDRISDYFATTYVQLGASYARSVKATERVYGAKEPLAAFLNAEDPSEIVFGSSTTQLFLALSLSMEASLFAAPAPAGSPHEIVVTDVDHEANVGCWERLAQRSGGRVVLRWWKLHVPTLSLRLEDLDALLAAGGPGAPGRTRLVCFSHCSNILGSLQTDAVAAAAIARRHGALTCVDGVGHAPHRATDVRALGVDFYGFSTYKVFGPHAAVLYGRRALLARLASLNHRFIPEDDLPYRLQPGGPVHELAHGAAGLVEYLEALAGRCCEAAGVAQAATRHGRVRQAFAAVSGYEERLAGRLLAFLAGRRGVRIIGPTDPSRAARVSTVSFVAEGVPSSQIVAATDAAGVGIRCGHFYAQRLVEETLCLGPEGGVVRVSMLHYNTEGELERLLAALAAVLPAG